MGDHFPDPTHEVEGRLAAGYPRGGHQPCQLAYEQRVAAGSSRHVVHRVRREAAGGQGAGKVGGVVLGERFERDDLDDACQPGEGRRDVDIAERPHDQQARALDMAGEEGQQRHRRLVGPLQVIEHDEQAARLGDVDKHCPHGVEDVELIGRPVAHRRPSRDRQEPAGGRRGGWSSSRSTCVHGQKAGAIESSQH